MSDFIPFKSSLMIDFLLMFFKKERSNFVLKNQTYSIDIIYVYLLASPEKNVYIRLIWDGLSRKKGIKILLYK